MNKKITLPLVSIILAVTLAACGSTAPSSRVQTANPPPAPAEDQSTQNSNPPAPAIVSTPEAVEPTAAVTQAAPVVRPGTAATAGVVETGQEKCYDTAGAQIPCPQPGEALYGQDANYQGMALSYTDNGDGAITDHNTGLMWQKAHNAERLSYYDAQSVCENLNLGGYSDWRLPTITELFSIANFSGSQRTGTFYIDTDYFDLAYPDESILADDPFAHTVDMMGQTWSSTIYTGQHWDREGVEAAFFFNFFDAHIKQAPTRGRSYLFYRCVRGNEYGRNDFANNGDGTVTDRATGLMWQQADDGVARNWEKSLAYCEGLTLAGYDDWRLPNVKELQSIVDYTRNDPALDTGVFVQTDPDGWFWSSTTHGDNTSMAAYVCFGKCVSVEGVDVHGAGAQRSDPKVGDPADWTSLGGQEDEVRIYNYARCVHGDAPQIFSGGEVEETGNAGVGRPGGGGAPPQEAIEACRQAKPGQACQINSPRGAVSGTCTQIQSQLACVP